VLSCYVIELNNLVRIVRRIAGVELSQRRLITVIAPLRMSRVRQPCRPRRSACNVRDLVSLLPPIRRSNRPLGQPRHPDRKWA
jgi:hypothetical protein